MFKLSLVEGLSNLAVPLFVCLFALFAPGLMLIPVTLTSVLFLFSYAWTFDLKNRLAVVLTGSLAVLFPLAYQLFLSLSSVDHSITVPFISVVLAIMLSAFGIQVFHPDRDDVIKTVSHSIVLGVFILSSYGLVMAENLFGGLNTNFLVSSILPYSLFGLLLSATNAARHFLKLEPLSGARLTGYGILLLLAAAVLIWFGLPFLLPSFAVSTLQFWLSIFVLSFSFLVTYTHFSTGKYLPAAILRSVFPIATSGILIYIIAAFIGG